MSDVANAGSQNPAIDKLNGHITEYLKYYTNLEKAPEFAVLLSGEWGSGKTWFISEFKKSNLDHKFLHISLYGLTNTDEIEDQFYQQLHPVLSSKPFTIGAKIFKGLLKGSLKIDLDSDGNDEGSLNVQIPEINIPDYLKNTEKCILIFDDFERCKIPINTCLGYINHFVEHQGQKVVILANEIKISDPDEFAKINEKLVGRKFKVLPNLRQALDSFIELLGNKETSKILKQHQDLIVSIYEKNEYGNLRTLRQTILEYSRFFELLPVKAKNHNEFQIDCINTIFSLYIYTKQGALEDEKISTLHIEQKDYNLQKALNKDKKNEIKKTNTIALLEKNFSGSSENIFPSIETISHFFKFGTVPEELMKSAVENSRYFITEKTPAWVRLWYIYDFSDTDFPVLFESVLKDFHAGEFKNPGILKHVCGILIGLSKKKMISQNLNQIKKEINKTLNKMIKGRSIDFIETVAFGHFFNDSYAGLHFTEYQSDEFQKISSILEAYQNDLEKEKIEEEAKELLVLMKTDSRKFLWSLCLTSSGESQRFLEVPVLAQIPTDEFISAYLESPSRNRLDIHHTIKKRYEYPQFAAKLEDEIKWLKKLNSSLKAKAGGLKQPTRYHVEEFCLTIENVIAKVNTLNPSQKSVKKVR